MYVQNHVLGEFAGTLLRTDLDARRCTRRCANATASA